MWLLFIIVLLNGQQVVEHKLFESDKECAQYKAQLQNGLASRFPDAKTSLTCSKLNDIGTLS